MSDSYQIPGFQPKLEAACSSTIMWLNYLRPTKIKWTFHVPTEELSTSQEVQTLIEVSDLGIKLQAALDIYHSFLAHRIQQDTTTTACHVYVIKENMFVT